MIVLDYKAKIYVEVFLFSNNCYIDQKKWKTINKLNKIKKSIVRICYIHTQSSECEKVKIEKRKSFFSGTSETLALAIDYPYLQKILLKNVNLDKYPILKKN